MRYDMIELCIFDMGGVVIRDFHIAPRLLPFLGHEEPDFGEIDPQIQEALREHSKGLIDEREFWDRYERITGETVPNDQGSLLGKFFTPVLDGPTVDVIRSIKARGIRVVCGTNVIDSHYSIHAELGQYDIFDHVYASHLMHIAKPDGAFFHYICTAERVIPATTFFTDDLQENVEAAQKAGLKAFLYTGAASLKRQLIDLGVLSEK